MRKLKNIGLALLLGSQIANGNPNVNKIQKNFSEGNKSEKVFYKNEANQVGNISDTIYETLDDNRYIAYILTPGSNVYKDSKGKNLLCKSPKGVVIHRSSINHEDSNEEFVCVQYKGNKVWIERTSLTDARGKTMEELEKPTTEKVIKVNKSARKMEVYDQYGKHKVKEFKIAISSRDDGDKTIEGDGNTPVGKYYICAKNPASSFGRNPKTGGRLGSLHVGYPNSQDAFEGLISGDITKSQFNSINNSIKSKGVPSQGTKLGNYIMIHGGGSSSDWTIGCMALDDVDMLRLYNYIGKGTDLYIE